VQLIHALIDTMLCLLRGLKSPRSLSVIDKIEEDTSRLFRLMCSASVIAKTSVIKSKWLDIFNYVMYVMFAAASTVLTLSPLRTWFTPVLFAPVKYPWPVTSGDTATLTG
jgi:hypothetical protein